MKDAIGQEIKVGDKVFHGGCRTVVPGAYKVIGLTEKRVRVLKDTVKTSGYGHRSRGSSITPLWDPSVLVVVTENLKVVRGESVVISNERLESLVDDSNLLTCLHGAGIDNCEAYSHGYQDFTELKNST